MRATYKFRMFVSRLFLLFDPNHFLLLLAKKNYLNNKPSIFMKCSPLLEAVSC